MNNKKTADKGKKKFPGFTTCQINNDSISTHALGPMSQNMRPSSKPFRYYRETPPILVRKVIILDQAMHSKAMELVFSNPESFGNIYLSAVGRGREGEQNITNQHIREKNVE